MSLVETKVKDLSQPDLGSMQKLLSFISRLEAKKIHYRLSSISPDAIMVEVPAPGERWEIEFFEDGEVAVEIFRSSGGVNTDEKLLDTLLAWYEDDGKQS